jgi:hypothetical protein
MPDIKKLPSLNLVMLLNACALLLIAILILRYLLINFTGTEPAVIERLFAQNEVLLSLSAIALLVSGVAMVILSIKSFNRPAINIYESQIDYALGWLCAVIGYVGLIAMLVFLILRKKIIALQAFSLAVLFFIFYKLQLMFDVNLVKTAARLVYPESSYNIIIFADFFKLIIYLQFTFFVMPVILVAILRFVAVRKVY